MAVSIDGRVRRFSGLVKKEPLPVGPYDVVLFDSAGERRTVYHAQRGEEALKFVREFLRAPKGYTIGIIPPSS